MSIRWKSFYPVYWSSGPCGSAFFATRLLEWNDTIFILACSFMGGGAGGGVVALGVSFLFVFFYF